MSLIIGVDSYVTLEEADAYHENMGNSAQWPGGASDDETIKKKRRRLERPPHLLTLPRPADGAGARRKRGSRMRGLE